MSAAPRKPHRQVRARRRAAFLLAALAVSVAGCGKHDLPTATVASHHQPSVRHHNSSHHAAPHRPLSAARARAFAHAVNLTAADIPGGRVAPQPAQRDKGSEEASRCNAASAGSNGRAGGGGGGAAGTGSAAGGSGAGGGGVSSQPPQIAQVKSPSFNRGAGLAREAINSAVTVLASSQIARGSVAPATSARWLNCYRAVLQRQFSRQSIPGFQLGRVRLTNLPVQLPGTPSSFGLRVSTTLTAQRSGLSIHLYLDLLGFTLGPAEVNLDATSFVQPEPSRTEMELLELLLARARANAL